MIFNLLVFVLIILMALYLATQGMVSALLALITATFSSLLAMGLTEPLEFLAGKVSTELQRGVTFLALYLIVFAITRITADILVPKNIKVPLLVNRIVGGAIGFFAALVVVGTIIIGLEMLPLPSTLLGYDRFPGEFNMQAMDADGKPVPGTVARASGIWLNPDRFTLALWDGASGRSLGGARAFGDVHPDLSVESYGFRRNLQYASKHTVMPSLFDAPAAYILTSDPKDAAELHRLGIKLDPGKKAAIIRTIIQKGDKPEISTADQPDDYFRITPSEVRLVTDKSHQYYPTGYLEFGNDYTKTDLTSGQIVEDYQKGKVVEDWVFQINDDERPILIDVKQTARKDLADVIKDKPVPALASADYPQKPYRKERSNLTITLTGIDTPTDGKALIIKGFTIRKDISSEVDTASSYVDSVLGHMNDSSGGWTADKAGLPSRGYFQNVKNIGIDIHSKDPRTDPVDWSRALQLLIAGQIQNDVGNTLAQLPAYINNTLLPLFDAQSSGRAVLGSADLKDTKVEIKDIPKGNSCVFVYAKTEKGFYVWIQGARFDPSDPESAKNLTFSANNANVKFER